MADGARSKPGSSSRPRSTAAGRSSTAKGGPDGSGPSGPRKRKASSGAKPVQGSGKGRIPPPPVVRDKVRVERVADGSSQKRSKQEAKRSRRRVDVEGVNFRDVPAATATKLERRLAEAAIAFEAERFVEAENLLNSIDRLAPGVAEVYELRAVTYYRLGRWMKAIADLERFYEQTGSVEQHPVWADCCRALRRWGQAEELWNELREASPAADLVEEGRMVQAGGLADRGRLDEAIRLLEKAPKPGRKPGIHHLRRFYVMADLYERSGDLARARRLFSDILKAEPDFGDVAERLSSLG